MKQKNKMLSTHGIKTLFETRLTQLTSLASESQDETAFKNKLNDYLLSGPIYNPAAARQIKRLIDNDGKTIYEASTEQEIKIETISLLWKFLTNSIINEEISVDLWIDLYHQFDRLYHEEEELPDEKQVQQWMKRWPSGLNEDVRAIRRQNKERIISASYPENRKQTRALQPLSFSRRKHGRGQTPAGLPMVERSPFSSGNGHKKPYRTEPNARQLPIRRDLAALSQSTQERNACLYHPLLSVFVESYGERI